MKWKAPNFRVTLIEVIIIVGGALLIIFSVYFGGPKIKALMAIPLKDIPFGIFIFFMWCIAAIASR